MVVLIDEYGKPIEDNLTNEELRETYRAVLQGFYSTLKVKDEKIKFAFLTGVSKIGKVSVFSGMNNLKDISMVFQYAELCGISETELQKYFDESIAIMAAEHKISKETCYRKLKEQYDGYRFHPDSEGVYNPFSLLNSLQDREFDIAHKLFSVPSRFGRRATLLLAAFSFASAAALLFITGILFELNAAFYACAATTAMLYAGGYLTIERCGMRMVNLVFFYENVAISALILLGTAANIFGR